MFSFLQKTAIAIIIFSTLGNYGIQAHAENVVHGGPHHECSVASTEHCPFHIEIEICDAMSLSDVALSKSFLVTGSCSQHTVYDGIFEPNSIYRDVFIPHMPIAQNQLARSHL